MQKEKPKIYILPGWGHQLSDKSYRALVRIVSKKYFVAALAFNTRNPKRSLGDSRAFSVVTADIDARISKPCSNDAILGFSIGALLAYQLSTYNVFAHTLLCSIAPCLGDDLRQCKKEDTKDLSETQYQEMSEMNYAPLRSKRVSVFFGEKEAEIVKKRSRAIAAENHAELLEIKGVGHDLNKEYLKVIKNLFF